MNMLETCNQENTSVGSEIYFPMYPKWLGVVTEVTADGFRYECAQDVADRKPSDGSVGFSQWGSTPQYSTLRKVKNPVVGVASNPVKKTKIRKTLKAYIKQTETAITVIRQGMPPRAGDGLELLLIYADKVVKDLKKIAESE